MAFNKNRKDTPTVDEKNIEINAQMQGNIAFNDPVSLKINSHFSGSLTTPAHKMTADTGKSRSPIAHRVPYSPYSPYSQTTERSKCKHTRANRQNYSSIVSQ